MLHEIAITPDVFQPEEIETGAWQITLKSVLRSLCDDNGKLLCNLYNGEWTSAVDQTAQSLSDNSRFNWVAEHVRSVLKTLDACGRLVPRIKEGRTPPCNDIEWLQEALASHRHVPFRVVVKKASTIPDDVSETTKSVCINLGELLESPLWTSPSRSVTVEREAFRMAQAVAPLLRTCRKVLFIDPYFRPGWWRYRKPLREFLRAARRNRYTSGPDSLSLLEFHTSNKDSPVDFWDQARRHLPNNIPSGLRLRLVRWRERKSGRDFHNRYILTNHGGVAFQHGLLEKVSDTDTVTLLDEPTRGELWRDFERNTSPYEYLDELEIVGNL